MALVDYPSSSDPSNMAASPPIVPGQEATDVKQSLTATIILPSPEPPEPKARSTCAHLAVVGDRLGSQNGPLLQEMEKRYVMALRWGRKVKEGEVKGDPNSADEDDHSDSERVKKRRKLLPSPECSVCSSPLHRPYLCLTCARPACHLTPGGKSCMSAHLDQDSHPFAVNIFTGTIHCKQCDDTVYDARFEAIRAHEKARASKGKAAQPVPPPATPLPPPVPCRTPRGLFNLGATCFLNVIIQAFMHNPLLRNYFLSDRHNPQLCPSREQCMACELDRIFAEFYTPVQPSPPPFAPTSFLFVVYLSRSGGSDELSSPGEHDAHELFISALSSMHAALIPTVEGLRDKLPIFPHGDAANVLAVPSGSASVDDDTPGLNEEMTCPCVIHRTFAGVLQSDVSCGRCGLRSSTLDPMLDLSLDIRSARQRTASGNVDAAALTAEAMGGEEKKKKYKKNKEGKDKGRDGSAMDEEQSLVACLRRYCAVEKLSKEDYSCAQCGQGSQAVKQLSLRRLPPVLCIQLKRFEHNASATKIETRVHFPQVLDLREFCTSAMREDVAAPKHAADAYTYDLFAVVVHHGKSINTGHYYGYFRWRDEWIRANDDKVAPVKLKEVMNCHAYQLMYMRRSLENVRPGAELDGSAKVAQSTTQTAA